MNQRTAVKHAVSNINEAIGRTVSWLLAAMVVLQMSVVLFRYVFGLGHPVAQDLISYMHAIVIMTLGGYALRYDAHVRVDVIYREAAPRVKAAIDLFGVLLFLWPMAGVMIWKSWSYVAGSWAILEGSARISGLQGTFVLKTFLLVFPALTALQGVALLIASVGQLVRPSPRDPSA